MSGERRVRLVKSVAYGYLGAMLAGLVVGVIGGGFGLSQEAVAAAATPAGVVFGTIGLVFAWRRPITARAKSR